MDDFISADFSANSLNSASVSHYSPAGESIGPDWDAANPQASCRDGVNQPVPESDLTPDSSDLHLENQSPDRENLFKLKHLGREFELPRDDVITLAQKGMDYDRIRERADSFAAQLSKNNPPSDPPIPDNSCRRDRELLEFVSEYKFVDPASIPSEVWADVERGKSLLSAFQSHENKLLRSLIDAERKNGLNRSRSIGSRSSAGAADERGELENDWYHN